MASTRSNTAKRRAARAASTNTPNHAFTAFARRAAHIPIAACTAATKTLTGWAEAADRFAHALGDELLGRVDGLTSSAELISGVAAATAVHLREPTALPRAAADHFETRLARVPIDN
jgi:hypothetical protein